MLVPRRQQSQALPRDSGERSHVLGRTALWPLWEPLPQPSPAPKGEPGLSTRACYSAGTVLQTEGWVSGNVMTRPHQRSQNRQAAGRGACLPSVSPATWTRTFLSISASVLSLLWIITLQLKCLLSTPEGMQRSRVFCSGSRTSGLRGSGRRNMPFLLLAEQRVWLLSGLERRPLTRASQHPGRGHP